MDAGRFDDLLRSLVESPTRRGIGRTLAGMAFVGTLGRLSQIEAEAKKRKKKKKKCKGGKKKCGKKCILKASCCKSADCPTGASCVNGRCVCPAGETDCEGACVDLVTDSANCGACGADCFSSEICVTGFCLTPCENPSAQIPLTNCPDPPGGFCATVDGIAVCVLGEAVCPPFALESCDAEPCPDGRVCANLHCGLDQFMCVLPAQGNACPDGQTVCEDACCEAGLICVDGQCEEDLCPPGTVDCGDTCVDLATDGANCGACDNVCVTGLCIHGACDCQNATANCPAGCSCGAREQGGSVCFGGVSAQGCDEDDDCDLGTNCLVNNFCSIACVA